MNSLINENESWKAKLYWKIMNVSESVFLWAREKWNKETKNVWFRPKPIDKQILMEEKKNEQ